MLKVILTSSLIATIITTIFQFISNQKSDNLKYITLERSQWRKELRVIAEEIQKANQQNIKDVLVKLRVRINAYGISYLNDCNRDGHLWVAMKVMENQTNIEEFEHDKELLVVFISLLLKQDWEKTKSEVKGNVVNILLFVLYVAFIGYLVYFNFFVCRLGFKIETIGSIILLVSSFFLMHREIYIKKIKTTIIRMKRRFEILDYNIMK